MRNHVTLIALIPRLPRSLCGRIRETEAQALRLQEELSTILNGLVGGTQGGSPADTQLSGGLSDGGFLEISAKKSGKGVRNSLVR